MHSMRALGALSALLLLSPACTASRPPSQTGPTLTPSAALSPAQVALRAFVDAHFEDSFRRFPTMATQAGIHTYDGELRGFTTEERMAHLAQLKTELEALPQQVDRAALPPLDRADYDILENHLRARILDIETVRGWERNPNTALSTVSYSLYQLINRDFAPLDERMRSAVGRMKAVPAVFTAAQSTLKNPPKLWTEIALMQAAGTRALYAETLPKAFAPVKDASLQTQFQQEQARCLAAIDGYIRFLREDLLPRSQGEFPIGEKVYRQKLQYEEGVTEDIDSLLAWGHAELKRTQAQFREVADRIARGKAPMDVYQALGKEHPTPEALVDTTRATLEELRQFVIDQNIITIPSEVRAQVAETPAFNRALSFASINIAGPFETRATEAYYYVTPPEPTWNAEQVEQHMSFYNRYALPIISIHEAYPGHYVQFLWTRQVESKVRKLLGSSSFSEGWGLYTEQMMLDEGYGGGGLQTDKLRLNQLALYLQRLARYMVGLSLHTRGMTYEQAVSFFEQEAYMTRTNAEREARRGTSDPTYLVYALGKKLILQLREDAQAKWGADFTLRRFHDELVSYGYPPIPILRRLLLGEDPG
ncbi:DUF885 domain-containing protein [Stigmatella aurantiaca]|uniref:Conserved uncharacterized protein n=1 Tax=Stigmatella aurantiaca (strain DW4/3-1) TaxID=378806 RepID=Q091W3_STIAD|nr:DUF885 domain-containing protein [Stigmatella aurantiaca]ADO71664.1 conserved uncharacterized protein [Stigmatella aurantiaca DW4/3-1]EAU66541.1 conserved hypothetical protein [Stigmatella aurantiaca DW4/3-1]